jgi:hypothetical protein
VTAGETGCDCSSGGGCASRGFGELPVATAADFSATAGAGFSAAAGAGLSDTEGGEFSAKEDAGFDGGGLRKESTKAHPPATQTAIIKITPAIRTAFCRVLRRGGEDVCLCRSEVGLSVSRGLLAEGETSPAFSSDMLRLPLNCTPPQAAAIEPK